MSTNVSLDDLEKRMKRLELSLKKDEGNARKSSLPGQGSSSLSNSRPNSSGFDPFSNDSMASQMRASPNLGLNFGQSSSANSSRPNSGLDFSNHIAQTSIARNSPSLALTIGQEAGRLSRPGSGMDHTKAKSSPNFSLQFNQTQPGQRKNRPSSGLDLSSSGNNSPAMQRKKKIAFALPTQTEPMKNYESGEVNKRLQEVISQNGNLRIGKCTYKAVASDFENMGEIGAGTCGQVYKMKFKHANHIMAVKQMHRSGNSEESKRILMDLDIVQKSHDCPHIVTCYGTLITESHVWICMELMSTCFDKLLKRIQGPLPEKIIGKLTVAVVKALHYLKENHGVIHRDVKPSNILVDRDGQIKLCDFGISGRLVDSKAKTRAAGCVAYMAPERIDPPNPNSPDYDIRADVWSLGVSLVELATGFFPYQNCTTDFEVLTKVLEQASPTLPQHLNFSIHFHQFVKLCCTKDYTKRPKYRELLGHEFIKLSEWSHVDIAAWLISVLNPTPAPTPTSKNPFYQPSPSQTNPFQTNDPFAFAGDITQAQFQQMRSSAPPVQQGRGSNLKF